MNLNGEWKSASLKCRAEDKKRGMTLRELNEFVQAAARGGVPEDTRVLVTLNWRSGIQAIETER